MLRAGMLETKRAKLMVALVTMLLLAAFQMALQAKPANAYEVRITVKGGGQVRETTPANLVGSNCSQPSTTPNTQSLICLAGTSSGPYGSAWDVDYVAEPAAGFTFKRWESDGTTRTAIICDRSTPAASTPTYTGAICKFRTFENLQTRAVFEDTTLPPTPTINSTSPSSTLVNGAKTFNFSTTSDPTFRHFECRVTPTVQPFFQSCSSGISFNPPDGSYTFQVRAVDWSGNISSSSASHSWTVDKTAPSTNITSSPPSFTNNNSANFSFSASETNSTFQCSLAGPGINTGFTSCSSGKSYSGLSDGQHTFQVRATDSVGNMGVAASHTWTVDLTAPTVSDVTPTHGTSGHAEGDDVTATFSEDMDATTLTGTTFILTKQGASSSVNAAVTYDDAAKTATLNPDVDLDSAATYTATVRGGSGGAKDEVGNPLAADRTWSFTTKDSRSPSVRLTRPANGATVGGTSVQLSAEATDNVGVRRVEFFVNDSLVASDLTAPYAVNWNPASITNGDSATIKARAVDTSGNRKTSAARTVTVDTAAPTVKTWTPTGKKVAPTAKPAVTFSEAMNKGSIQASRNGKPTTFVLKQGTTVVPASVSYVESRTTFKATLTPSKALKRGATYNVTVTKAAKDKAGNALVPKSWKFTVKK